MNISELRTGDCFRAMIDQDIVSGKVFVDDKEERIFLCQNYRQGYESPDLLGYQCSWLVTCESDGAIEFSVQRVSNFEITKRAPRPKIKKADTRFAMSPDFTTEHIYRGKNGYHCGVGYNLPKFSSSYRIGIELETVLTDPRNSDPVLKLDSNWFYMEHDGSLGSDGVEIITLPMNPSRAKNIETWKPFTKYFSKYLKSWDTSCCGMHVHISKEALGMDEDKQNETFAKMLYLYSYDMEDNGYNNNVFGRTPNNYCVSGKDKVVGAVKELGVANVKMGQDLADRIKHEADGKGRYHELSMNHTHTIEFRRGKGSLNPERITGIITYCDLMIKYCKATAFGDISGNGFREYVRKKTDEGHPLRKYLRLG
jgi:hypothetical protein